VTKPELRRVMRARLREVGPAQAAEWSRRACERVAELPEFAAAGHVMAYVSFATELQTAHLCETIVRLGKRLYVPRVRDAMTMEACPWDGDPATLIAGFQTVPEPRPEALAVDPARVDLIIVPGLAFDESCMRLGRGRGYYDRFLSDPRVRAKTCGLAYECQVADALPADPHDKPVDLLVTEARVRVRR
jgi:5-formyltetrahydrofolate cyclo-ligase